MTKSEFLRFILFIQFRPNLRCGACLGLLLSLVMLSVSAHAQIIDVVGSTTVKALMDPAVEAYRQLQPNVIIHVSGGGSGIGAVAMIDGRASIGMMSREPDVDEATRMRQQGIERVRIARDAVAVVISDALYHKGDVHVLKVADIAAIFQGGVRNWKAVGGPDRRILVIDKVRHSGTRHVFAKFILGDGKADVTSEAVIVGNNKDMKTLLVASDQAIGFLPFGAVNDDSVHAVALLQAGKNYVADSQSVRDGSYPIRRSLYLLYKKDAPAYVHAFIEYLRSPKGAVFISTAGYLPVRPEADAAKP